ncbi:MAG TPA: RDD family protein [Acidimicrobiales bacterium]|nr:RDD family protein [Acidimicrobiales bacterium]
MGLPDPLSLFGAIATRAVDSINLNEVLDHVDINGLVARVDINAVMDRVDVEALLSRVDIADIVRRAEIDALLKAKAASFWHRLLDFVHRALAWVDVVSTSLVDRLLRRGARVPPVGAPLTDTEAAGATRLAAFLLDTIIVAALFSLVSGIGLFMGSLFVGHHLSTNGHGPWYVLGFVLFALLYQWVCLVVAGRTPGRGFVGLRVTASDGSPLGVGSTTRRVLVYPFSFILGLGLIGIIVGKRHRALHDVAAPSLVHYDWGDVPEQMPGPLAGLHGPQRAKRTTVTAPTSAAGEGGAGSQSQANRAATSHRPDASG